LGREESIKVTLNKWAILSQFLWCEPFKNQAYKKANNIRPVTRTKIKNLANGVV
jgi:hypothetical protein